MQSPWTVNGVTDSQGEAWFQNVPAGRYQYRVRASNHQESGGRLQIKPGVTVNQPVFLDYNLIQVEWSVQEITIEDRYEITLNATYETYLWTDEGWLYLAVVLDLFNREIVGWSLKPRMTADIVTDALTMAWFRKRPAAGLMHHSDRGSQYASHAFQETLKRYGMTCSMSRKGNCWDNAPTESWFNRFKNERVHGVRYATHAQIKAAAFEYIEVFYNRKRQHSTLGYKSPVQFLETWFRQQQREKQVA